ncbi:hypothetical protein ACFDR9_004247 [Janthinobacterium sp. CG_23.3]|uniref:hypothetical protein n=1 Tax=unclassified Janthinobacterium TaxID=2610881 RepID=UPI00034999E9|nr:MULTISPECIES: hypothetical protein [unclassified Janthinobacterium]MEC5163101.1 hypothetical protein [Janthinobacterium sp. CG_S6]
MRAPWGLSRAAALAWLAWLAAAGPAAAFEPLSDAALSAVRGGDGVSFDLAGFSMSGDARVTYTAAPGRSLYTGAASAARSDGADPFGDPYRLDVVGAAGRADYFQLAFPLNAAGAQRWQFAYDWGVTADGVSRDGGSVVWQDARWYGGGLQFATPEFHDGVAFGLALHLRVGELALRPRGRGDASEQLALRGIRLGGVDADGNFDNTPWVLADVAAQPALLNALSDESGPRLHFGIGWPDARFGNGAASSGALQVDNICFVSAGRPTVDLGSSRIGALQIQYLDVKFKR